MKAIALLLFVAACPVLLVCGQGADSSSGNGEVLERTGNRNVRLHDPSTIVREKDTYWLFHTGRGTPSYWSNDLRDWTAGPRVFTNAPAWVLQTVPNNRAGLDFWAPDVIYLSNRFLLYYSVSTFGRNRSAIGLVSNKTLDPSSPDYKWFDEGIVIQSVETNNFNAIDPAVIRHREGRLWMSFGSFWDGIKLIELDGRTGKRIQPDSTLYSLARNEMIEAPYIYESDGGFYLFVNWGRCCQGTNSTYNLRVGRSSNITGPYRDRDGLDMAQGGGSLLLETEGTSIGPGHAGIIQEGTNFWMSLHFYDGNDRGRSKLVIHRLTWDEQGWPVVLKD